ncbi:ShlB/FhaC/HecB family hemolysin secretion/activation protein [Iodobacter sp.]|uniref:ShlB/FhaC/HecB family hemolysin secretion/activation protein n=1 Tax=Iodobacter sp. TaxID=1915058 RepID=UPI0025FF04F6|nr:ShlB/FhaC/HecB family hemolysin secretion/activation protein [Iodobacter sp.]
MLPFTRVLCLSTSLVSPFILADNFSQQPAGQSVQDTLRRQEDRIRDLNQTLKPSADELKATVLPTLPSVLPIEQPCFVLKRINVFAPASRLPLPDWLLQSLHQQVFSVFTGQCAGVNGLSQIAAAADAELLRMGLATSRVVVPPQNMGSGELNLQLHLGRIAGVRMQDEGKDDTRWGTWVNAFPSWPLMSAGDVLNVHNLEQGVEQMNRLPSQHVVTRLEPGTEPDTSVVFIDRQSGDLLQRLRGGITLDNSGSPSLGRTQLSSYLALDNALGLNDILNLSFNTNAENPDNDHQSQSVSANYSIPWGNHTFSSSYSSSKFAQWVAGTTARFLSSGESESADLRWQYQLLRTSSARFSVSTALSSRRSNSYLDDVELLVQRRRTTQQEFGMNYRQLVGSASFDLGLNYKSGRGWYEAEDDYPAEMSNGLTLRPSITTLDFGVAVPFQISAQAVQYNFNFHGQSTPNTTLSNEQIAIGGRSSVRGFDGDTVLMAENGYYLRNEFSTSLPMSEGLGLQAYWGLDFGRVWGPSDVMLTGHKLAGTALGLRGQWKKAQFDLSAASPLHQPEGMNADPYIWYGSVTLSF